MSKLEIDDIEPFVTLVRKKDGRVFFVHAIDEDTGLMTLECFDWDHDECLEDMIENYKLPELSLDRFNAIMDYNLKNS